MNYAHGFWDLIIDLVVLGVAMFIISIAPIIDVQMKSFIRWICIIAGAILLLSWLLTGHPLISVGSLFV